MNFIKQSLITVFLLIPFFIFSQSTVKDISKDELIRASYASYYIDEVQEANYIFNTPSGEAKANIILKVYRDLLIIPEVSLDNIDAEDKAKIEKLIQKLNQLSKNPPSWDEIVLLEKERLINWDKAVRQKSKYKKID